MATPVLVALLGSVIAVGLMVADLAVAASVAREVVRTAAVGEDHRIPEVLDAATATRAVTVSVQPGPGQRSRGDLLTATVRLAPVSIGPLTGPAMEGRAVMRAEVVP